MEAASRASRAPSAAVGRPKGWQRSSVERGTSGACFSCGFGETWQQAMPQQRPSSVPQQQCFSPAPVEADTVAPVAWPTITRGNRLNMLKLSSKLAVMKKRNLERMVFMSSALYGSHATTV